MTFTPEEEEELEEMLGGIESEEKEDLPTTSELEAEAAKVKEKQKTLAGDDADPKKLKKNGEKQKTEGDLELEYHLLKILGFEEYDDRATGKGLKYKQKFSTSICILTEEIAKYPRVWITRKYSDKYPNGRFSAVPLDEEGNVVMRDEKTPSFLKREDCMKLPPIANFYKFRESGYIPPKTVIGHLVSVKGNSRCIEIHGDQGEEPGLRISYPKTLINKNKDGDWFIPANLSIMDTKGKKRMDIPRTLIIENYKEEEERLWKELEQQWGESEQQQRQKEKKEPPDYVPEEVTEREFDKRKVTASTANEFDWQAEMAESAEHYRLAFKAAEEIVRSENIAEEYELSALDLLQFTHEIAKDINYNTEKRFRTPPKGTGGY